MQNSNYTAKQKAFLASLTPAQRNAFMVDLLRSTSNEALTSYATPDGIIKFVREKIGADPAPYQERILSALVTDRRVAVRGPHGLGKTALASWAVIWGVSALGDDVKVVTTASVWRQLEKYLWPEIKKWTRRAKLDYKPRILNMSLKFDDQDKEAFAIASDDPYSIEGAHAEKMLYILDESKAIPDEFWDAIEGALSTGDYYVLSISTPGQPSGRFYDIHSRKAGYQDWTAIHVTLDEAIAAGRIAPEWVEARKIQWGELSPVYQTRVLGEFADGGEDSVIPLSWVEASNKRWHEAGGKGAGHPHYGVDPARYGTDKTAIARLAGYVCEWIRYSSQEDTMQTTGRVAALATKTDHIGVDIIGLGAGVYDRLNELGYRVIPVNVAERAVSEYDQPYTDESGVLEFVNIRSYIWWKLREWLDPNGAYKLALPEDDALTGDLVTPAWTYTSTGKIKVESKDDIRKRLGRSTDAADALGIAVFVASQEQGVVAAFVGTNTYNPMSGSY